MDVAERLEGIVMLVRSMKKIYPEDFGVQPVSGFINALAYDLETLAEEWELSSDD